VKFPTSRFGEIEVDDAKILHLPDGIIGFPDFKRAALLDHQPDSPFRWLQGVDHPEIAFVVIDPLALVPDYPLDTLKQIIAKDDKRPEEIAVAAITTVPKPPQPITVNLSAPIVIDPQKKSGAQVILNDTRFGTRHILVQEPPSKQAAE
jgi:flagellar assembly factor FliW